MLLFQMNFNVYIQAQLQVINFVTFAPISFSCIGNKSVSIEDMGSIFMKTLILWL